RLISWKCKKQTIVASSTTEAEYVVAAHYCGQVLHHFVRDAYEKKLIQMLKIHTDDNVAGLLTKAFDVTSKELASPKQTALGKDISNPLMAGRLPKTTLPTSDLKRIEKDVSIKNRKRVVCKNRHKDFLKVNAASPKLTTARVSAAETKPTKSEGFEQIIDFLNGSSVSYALTASPTIRTSCIKQFWTTAKVKTINDEVRIQALIDEKRVNIKESSIYRTLKLDDAEGTSCLANAEIFEGLAKMVPKQPLGMNLAALWHPSPSPSNDPLPGGKDSLKLKELMDLCTHLSNKVLELESEVIDIKSTYKERIEKLEVDTTAPVVEKERSFKQGRIIADIDEDVEINLEEAQAKPYRMDLKHTEKVLSMQDVNDEEPAKVEEVLEVVTAAKLITEVVTTARATTIAETTKVSVLRKRRGLLFKTLRKQHQQLLCIQRFNLETKEKNVVIEQVKSSERLNDALMKYQALNRKPLTKAQARKYMIIYLKNMAGYKMNYFKGMTYSKIRPLFEKHYNYNQAFLEEVNEEVTVPEKEVKVKGHKRKGKSIEKEITKKQKINEEAEELKSHLQIVSNDDDDVYTEATPLALKIPIFDYKIHLERNKPYFKIIRANGNHMLFLSFSTLLKNFDREDQESLWKLVKESVWRDQKGRYRLAKISFEHFTLEQMMNNVRLEVEEESEMYLELLRLIRRQLNEGGGLLRIMDFNISLLLFILSAAAWNYCWLRKIYSKGPTRITHGFLEIVLTWNHKQTLITSDIEDRLTKLPETLIVSILERL
nr:hypothetical protein [Tanacetum cinerariifolium]